jgi:signal transduction histidine kinase
MGGKLTLRSPLGEGTSLVIELPLELLGISTREVLD